MKQQLLRRLGLVLADDDNPLRRPVDKLECAIITCLIVAFFIAAPFLAVFTAGVVGAAGTREMRAETSWRQVPAVLQQGAAAGAIGMDGDWNTAWVKAHWTAPDGAHRTGLVAVSLNARAGQRVTVWVTWAGKLTHQRLTRGELTERTAMAAVTATAGLALLLTIAVGMTRVLANRRRMACWAREWEATGPRWSSLR